MTVSKGKGPEKPPEQSTEGRSPETAFDNWLNRGLHEIFDDVMNEPIPPELLKILQDEKKK